MLTASLEALSVASLDAVISVDHQGIILGWNSLAEKYFGWTEEEAVGRLVHELIIPERYRSEHLDGIMRLRAMASARTFNRRFEGTALRRDGSEIPVELSILQVPAKDGEVLVCFLRDLSEQREAQGKLEELQSRLLHMSRVSAMGTMAATLAHELNQPLTAASNYLSATSRLLEGLGAPEAVEARFGLSRGREAVMRAAEMIQSVRQMAEKKPHHTETQSLRRLVQESRRLLGDNLQVPPRLHIAADADAIHANRVQMEQVLINLLRNASEAAGEDREIDIFARRDGDKVEVQVIDNGPGIAAHLQEVLFSPLNSSKPDGLGMGLSICRTIIEQHGGRIWAESGPVGTSVCFTVAAARTS